MKFNPHLLRLLLSVIAAVMLLPGCSPRVDSDALRSGIERLVSRHAGAEVAVSIRDPLTGLVLDLKGDRLFHAASTMKVPVMIEIFRMAESGELGRDDSLLVENRFHSIVDGSEYAIEDDSDDTIYERLGSRMSIDQLIHQMVTVSSNLATNILIGHVTAEAVQATSERLGTLSMRTLRGVEDLKAYEQGLSNRTTSADLAVLLEALMQGRAVNPGADRQMVDVLLAQEFNEMIPAGVPAGVRVAHKTGQITAIHHDAAIVFPEAGDPFVLVVLIEGIEDDTESASLGADIAALVYRTVRPEA